MKEQLNGLVYRYIIDKIKADEWKQGDRIYSEAKLCEVLNVSRIAVRTALDRLAALGVLEKRKGSGTYVVEINMCNIVKNITPLMTLKQMELKDILRFRLYFEPANIAEFMDRDTRPYLEKLKKVYNLMEEHAQNHKLCSEADCEFHSIIARGTENPIVISISEMLTGILLSSIEINRRIFTRTNDIKAHKEILNAIQEGDKEVAILLMKRHIQDNLDNI